ncbi:MAG: hypothetical protein GX981_11450 [Tissierellia bacterium]|nr:hypothetical protein [Tissierellia bacterium]
MTKRKELFNVGDRVEIIREGTKNTQFYPSQILDITGGNTYVVSGPIHKNNTVLLHKGETIGIAYLVKNKGMYIFDAIILKREYLPIYKLEIEKISEIKKYQKREYYRFETSIPVIKEQIIKTEDGEEVITENCRTKDISGGGLKLLSNFKHNIGDNIVCKFHINEQTIKVESKVLRIEDIDTFDYKYALGVNFLDISEKDRDIIIKFIFEEERLLREKGVI